MKKLTPFEARFIIERLLEESDALEEAKIGNVEDDKPIEESLNTIDSILEKLEPLVETIKI